MDTYVSTAIGVASILFATAILVQIIEEIYKYLWSSKSKAYQKVLVDHLGTYARVIIDQASLGTTGTRGPFSIGRLFSKPHLQPLNVEEMGKALVKTLPTWVQLTLEKLENEITIQGGVSRTASPQWKEFLQILGESRKGAPGSFVTEQIVKLLKDWGHSVTPIDGKPELTGTITPPENFDARMIKDHVFGSMASYVKDAIGKHAAFEKNFDYTYTRRIWRHTIIISVIACLLLNLRIDHLIKYSAAADPESNVEYALAITHVYDSLNTRDSNQTVEKLEPALKDVYSKMAQQPGLFGADSTNIGLRVWTSVGLSPNSYLTRNANLTTPPNSNEQVKPVQYASFVEYCYSFLFCCLSALLVSAGAPIWNDIVSALIGLKKQVGSKPVKGA